jgi:hypothetical protein
MRFFQYQSARQNFEDFMNRLVLGFSVFLITSAQASQAAVYIKDCQGTSDQGSVEVRISTSTVKNDLQAPLQGYFQADVLVNGANVYSSPDIAYNSEDQEYFTAGNSDLVLSETPDTELYLHVLNADGSVTVPSFDTIPLTCQ